MWSQKVVWRSHERQLRCWWSVLDLSFVFLLVFFFQAEDGIRDRTVTGVQTCALPICGSNYVIMKNTIMDEVKRVFNPEFLNRIDEMIVFHPLDRPQMGSITKILLGQVADRMKGSGITLNFEDEVVDLLIQKGFDEALGARPLKRSIQKLIEDPLSEHVLRGQLKEGSDVLVSRRGDELIFAS